MDNQSVAQKAKSDPKWKAYISLIFVLIVTIMFTLFVQYFYYGAIVLFGTFIISILGLVFGAGGLYSTKKTLLFLD